MSQLIFNPESGLESPDTGAIRQEVAQDWKTAFYQKDKPELNTEPSTPAGQLVDDLTAEIEAKNADVLYLANQFNPATADGRWQDALGYIYFLRRKADEPTVVTCTVTGGYGVIVPYGALVKSATGHTLICNRAVAIGADGTAQTTFRCTENGPIEIPAGSVTSIVTTIPGWDTVLNEAAGATGRNLETRAEFENRRYQSVAMNSHGSVGAIYGTIANLDGVIDCAVLENIGPDPVIKFGVEVPGHGVVPCVYGGEDEAIAEAIYRKKDAGCDTGGNTRIVYTAADYHNATYEFFIMRPEPVNFLVKVTLGEKESVTTAIQEAVRQAIYTDFLGGSGVSGNPRVSLASRVFASRFYTSVVAIPGLKSLRNVEIALEPSSGQANFQDVITINGDQEPVMTPANVTIILED